MTSANRSQSPIVKYNKRKAPEMILIDKKVKIFFLLIIFVWFLDSSY